MGSKRIGLARVEKLLENLKRDIEWGSGTKFNGQPFGDVDIPCASQGLSGLWASNFGGPTLEGLDPDAACANLLTPGTTALKMSRVLEGVAARSAVPTVANAATALGGTGVLGVDVAIGTTASPGTTPTVAQRISRLTGDVSGTVVMAAGADMTGANDATLILFTGNTFSSSGILKLTLAADNELQANSFEMFVTADGTDQLTRVTAASDDDQIIILTDTGDCTILAGSFIYLHADDGSDDMQCKGVIRTTGGTIAVTFGN